jgi:hypothetical protein
MASARVAAGDPGDEREFEMYPPNLWSPYRDRQVAAARQRFDALAIAYEDRHARAESIAGNWNCFGVASVAAMLCPPQLGAAAMGGFGHVAADGHASASRRGPA